MNNALYIAETGLNAQRIYVDNVSNNIANVNTSGYKRAVTEFFDISSSVDYSTDRAEDGIAKRALHGVRVSDIKHDLSVGPMRATGRDLDVAVQGDGFFELELPNGENAYTRIGRFSLDKNGYLVSSHGYRLSASVAVPPEAVSIEVRADGMVVGKLSPGGDHEEIGQISLVKFMNSDALIDQGEGIFSVSEKMGEKIVGTPGEDGFGSTLHRFIEESNVVMTKEMVELMIAQRGYQLNARLLQIANQLAETTNNLFQ